MLRRKFSHLPLLAAVIAVSSSLPSNAQLGQSEWINPNGANAGVVPADGSSAQLGQSGWINPNVGNAGAVPAAGSNAQLGQSGWINSASAPAALGQSQLITPAASGWRHPYGSASRQQAVAPQMVPANSGVVLNGVVSDTNIQTGQSAIVNQNVNTAAIARMSGGGSMNQNDAMGAALVGAALNGSLDASGGGMGMNPLAAMGTAGGGMNTNDAMGAAIVGAALNGSLDASGAAPNMLGGMGMGMPMGGLGNPLGALGAFGGGFHGYVSGAPYGYGGGYGYGNGSVVGSVKQNMVRNVNQMTTMMTNQLGARMMQNMFNHR